MKKSIDKKVFGKIPWIAITIAVLALISLIITIVVQSQTKQAEKESVSKIYIDGEYRIAGGDWHPISEAKHISTTKGNVEFKGTLQLYDSQTGETLGAVESGTEISLYLDHVKAIIKDANGNTWMSDNENEQSDKNSCAEVWTEYKLECEEGEELLITLYNPHIFGNEKAADSFLNSIQVYDAETHNQVNSNAEKAQVVIGIFLLVFFFALLAVALFFSLLRIKYNSEIWLASLLVLFGGLYFIFSLDKIGVWNRLYAFNTMLSGFAMMFYLLTMGALISSFLSGKERRTAIAATSVLGIATVVSMIAATIKSVKFYNVYPYWTPVALGACLVLIVCILRAMFKRTTKDGAVMTRKEKIYICIPVLVALVAFIVDVVGEFFGLWQGGLLSVIVFLLLVLAFVVVIVRVIPKSIRTVIEAKELAAEKQAMELKLQESRISIMLSQIQPHFLYNTLNSIYQLCETNPMLARSMVNSFAEYLRNNLSSLDEPGLVSFETELAHIKTYLDIEKIRFDDTLDIEYDIKCVDFTLPVLTVQPIVENAVKHGTSKKRGGGKVTISTVEDDEAYIITVSDTGKGFDTSKPKNDGKKHVGIENVRQRLSNMCSGVLTIESKIDVGTVATIKIPKEVEK